MTDEHAWLAPPVAPLTGTELRAGLPAAPLVATPAPAPAPGAGANDPFGRKRPRGRLRQKLSSGVAAVVALVAKFGVAIKGILIALPNLKLFITAGTALVSVAAYSLFFGWWFAVGFVVLIFVHEMGHVIALRREGIKASAPMFIPFMGAVITARSLGDNALAEARVGLAGPILGSLGAACVAVAGALLDSNFLLALAYIGFLINLFNLLPIVPLDGGRAMAAMAPWMWFLGFGGLVALMFLNSSGNPILPIIVLFAAFDLYRRWRHRRSRTLQSAAYYRVSRRNRVIVGAVYLGLIVALVFGMNATHILANGGHSFTSI